MRAEQADIIELPRISFSIEGVSKHCKIKTPINLPKILFCSSKKPLYNTKYSKFCSIVFQKFDVVFPFLTQIFVFLVTTVSIPIHGYQIHSNPLKLPPSGRNTFLIAILQKFGFKPEQMICFNKNCSIEILLFSDIAHINPLGNFFYFVKSC